MRWHAVLWTLPALWLGANAIYQDEAFHVDYHEALLGIPQAHTTFFHKPQSLSNASLLYTLSDKAVLGAVNPKDGSLLWRQAIAGQPVRNAAKVFLVAGDGDGRLTTGYAQEVISWDALSGRYIGSYRLPQEQEVLGLQVVSIASQNTAETTAEDVVVLAGSSNAKGVHTEVIRLATDGSSIRWQHTEPSSDVPVAVAVSADEVYYVSRASGILGAGKTKVDVLDISTGKVLKQISLSLDAEAVSKDGHFSTVSGAGFPFVATSEKPYKNIKFNVLGTQKVHTLVLEDKDETIEKVSIHQPSQPVALPHLLVHVRTKTRHWAEIFHVDPKSGEVSKAYTLPATAENSAFAASSVDANVYFTRVTDTDVIVYSSASHGILTRWKREVTSNVKEPWSTAQVHATAEVVARGKTGLAVRVVKATGDGEWTLIRNGDTQWSRPEGLSYATVATWADDGRQKRDELEAEASANPVSAYLHRVQRHVAELVYLPAYLRSLPAAILQPISSASDSRSAMLGHKLVIVGTSRREILALDTNKAGARVWRADLGDVVNPNTSIVSLLVREGQIWAYISDGSLVILNVTDGTIIEQQSGSMATTRLVELPGQPEAAVIKINQDGEPQLSGRFSPSTATEGNSLVTLNQKHGLRGWTVGQTIQNTWTLKPATGTVFINAISRPNHDPVASIGKVLGDRSVLYKHLSPNLALLTALSSTTLTVSLIDAVTGSVLYASTNPAVEASASIPSAMSENWFAYSFTSKHPTTHAITTSLVITELYESDVANDRGNLGQMTNYSSFSADAASKPHVISQSFTIFEPISDMSVTQTTQGITSRQLLCVLPNSNAIMGIPRHVLDARRPVDRDANAQEAEEGLFRYQPNLDLDPRWYLTHTREVMGIDQVISSPTLLESTSLVFGFGHDIFGTRISPSMAFDVLDKGFNKIQLILTVVALGVGTAVLAPLVRKKQVDGRWQT